MKLKRRTFLKTSGSLLAMVLAGGRVPSVSSRPLPGLALGKEIPGRCPLCGLGCGVIYRSLGLGRWHAEGDPDCPVAKGSLCARGAALGAAVPDLAHRRPLYRPPGGSSYREMDWDDAVDLAARRIKDLRDRDLAFFSAEGESPPNRFDSLGVIAGGCLTNEESYALSKLFRALGVTGMDTTVRSSHGMAVQGLMDTLGLPGATHPVTQVSYSDVVILVGSNPGQTAPALCRFLDRVRERKGTVVILDPRKTETVKKGDLWLQVRPGTDKAVLGAFLHWILEHADIRKGDLLERSDAPYMVLSEIMGQYEVQATGRNRNQPIVDTTLSEPYTIFQRMREHFRRYDLRKISSVSGVDIHLLRRACRLLARTGDPNFSASFVLGSGALASPSGQDTVRMAAAAQVLLGNLEKRGGGVILPTAAGNAQGVCDMGLLAPFLPGYIPLPEADRAFPASDRQGLEALARAWYPTTPLNRSLSYFPHLDAGEKPCLSTIIRGVGDEQVRALLVVGADPLSSLTDNGSIRRVLDRLDLLIVLDSTLNRTCGFWQENPGRESTLKTEVLYLPTEPPSLKAGSMTDPGRRVRVLGSPEMPDGKGPGLLDFLVGLGNSIRGKYGVEGGLMGSTVTDLSWPLTASPSGLAEEVNGWRLAASGEVSLPRGGVWEEKDRCGNRLYRGILEQGTFLAERRDPSDPHGIALFDRWGWHWPWGVADPYSWFGEPGRRGGVPLRWKGQGDVPPPQGVALPFRSDRPVKFWRLVEQGSPLPEHLEPFHSPLNDVLTGGSSNPNLELRREMGDSWGYLSRRPEPVLSQFPVIISLHRTGNVMGTGGVTGLPVSLRELGVDRLLEIGMELAGEMGVVSGDRLLVVSPYYEKGIPAVAVVTRRIGSYRTQGGRYHVASLTLNGEEDAGANALTSPAFDILTGGMEMKVFMGRIEKA